MIRSVDIELPNITLATLQCGQGPLVICAHGFPDTAHSFEPVLQHLAAAGYHAVAPFLRGYAPSALAADGDYRITTVADDLLALIDALGAERAVLVGHDWGAVATYIAAAKAPDKLAAIVTAAVPHLRRFLLQPSARQLYRSRYMGFFQLRGIAERRMAADDFAWLRALIKHWSPSWQADARALAPVLASLSQPQYQRAALGYYRSLPGVLANPRNWPLIGAPLAVPAQVICGAQDGCIGAEMFESQAHLFSAGYALSRFEDAGHFMHCEQPQRFAEVVLAHLAQHAPTA
ncbi:alpha/beta fold hydrolase [Sinimarinibacterium sp. NLF-5-8]|uniref:alpha/beta fold hydrolase n=1 Tax=Sinimarinibacterium sp. NLF-5-8 TaxID=2698684 RepID=UPI00137C09F0|nr:alpha/beta hydrolase [Sinimarinibacterium sp. NLF-5-8]QHS11134.1 alpha/beta hydrolase [Sinimarinibacterium sp. NLF-5-8]